MKMKTKNYTKEYLSNEIGKLFRLIRQTKWDIHTCEIVCAKEKLRLNNTNSSHDILWQWRSKLHRDQKLLKLYKKEYKELQQIFTSKFNKHYDCFRI